MPTKKQWKELFRDVGKGIGHEFKGLGKEVKRQALSGWGEIISEQIFGKPKKNKGIHIHIHDKRRK